MGGALGIAVLGSVLTGRYRTGPSGAFAHAPAEVIHRAQEGLPAVIAMAKGLGANGAVLAARAQASFVDGLSLAMLIAAASVAAAAIFVFLRAPRRTGTRPAETPTKPMPGTSPPHTSTPATTSMRS